MKIQGRLKDIHTGQPVQGATVTAVTPSGAPIAATTSNDTGFFILDNPQILTGDVIRITHVSYMTQDFPVSGSNDYGFISLENKVIELPPVVITAPSKTQNAALPLLLIAALAAASTSKNKSISGIKPGDAILVGGAVVAVLGLDIVKKLLESVGLWKSKDVKEVQDEIENPNSPFSPNFWKTAPAGSLLLTTQTMADMLKTLKNAFGFFDDNEAAATGVFKQMKTQSQVSFFSDYFTKNEKADLLTWLRGSSWPNDRLSAAELNEIIQFVNKLPKYKP
jgi:hypothetical protein